MFLKDPVLDNFYVTRKRGINCSIEVKKGVQNGPEACRALNTNKLSCLKTIISLTQWYTGYNECDSERSCTRQFLCNEEKGCELFSRG